MHDDLQSPARAVPRDPAAAAESQQPRGLCPRCQRPTSMCLCRYVVPVRNRTEVMILQHPREHRHPFNTAQIARLALERLRWEVHWGLRTGPSVLDGRLPPRTALLYPGPGAAPLESLAPEEVPHHLLVLDGTWPQSRSLLRRNPAIAALPRVEVRPRDPSAYRIRTEPTPEGRSTIEAIYLALAVLEPDTPGLDGLLVPFHAMIEQHLAVRERRFCPRRRLKGRGGGGAPGE